MSCVGSFWMKPTVSVRRISGKEPWNCGSASLLLVAAAGGSVGVARLVVVESDELGSLDQVDVVGTRPALLLTDRKDRLGARALSPPHLHKCTNKYKHHRQAGQGGPGRFVRAPLLTAWWGRGWQT
jgi:hypothetical protein